MKKFLSKLYNIFVVVLTVVAVCVMVFTIISVRNFNQNYRQIFGYKMYVVLSDSMSATDFDAGDLVLVKNVDPNTLQEGDIITYISRDEANFGSAVTHKIRCRTIDGYGRPAFITYGTTTGKDDNLPVPYEDVQGIYKARIPAAGRFFEFLRTVPGYLLCILLPFLLLIARQSVLCAKEFKKRRNEQMRQIAAEREQLQKDREDNERLLKELKELQQRLGDIPAASQEETEVQHEVTEE